LIDRRSFRDDSECLYFYKCGARSGFVSLHGHSAFLLCVAAKTRAHDSPSRPGSDRVAARVSSHLGDGRYGRSLPLLFTIRRKLDLSRPASRAAAVMLPFVCWRRASTYARSISANASALRAVYVKAREGEATSFKRLARRRA